MPESHELFWADVNDCQLPLDQVQISPLDRGYLFGNAIYEGLRVYQNIIFLLDEPMKRLANSLAGLDIDYPASIPPYILNTTNRILLLPLFKNNRRRSSK